MRRVKKKKNECEEFIEIGMRAEGRWDRSKRFI